MQQSLFVVAYQQSYQYQSKEFIKSKKIKLEWQMLITLTFLYYPFKIGKMVTIVRSRGFLGNHAH